MSGVARIPTSLLSVRCKCLPNSHVISPWKLLRHKTTTQAPPTLDDIISPLKGAASPQKIQEDADTSNVNTSPPPHSGHDDISLADITKPVPFNTHHLVCRLQAKGNIVIVISM